MQYCVKTIYLPYFLALEWSYVAYCFRGKTIQNHSQTLTVYFSDGVCIRNCFR